MMLLNLLPVFSPEETKTIGIVAVLLGSVVGALLYPLARAFARRLDGGSTNGLREELADISARLEVLQHGQERMAELEGRLEFAERILAQQREAQRIGPQA